MLSSVASTPSSFKAATVLSTTSNETYPIAPGVAATLASTAPVLSSSCAYAHFLNYGLRLSEREKYGFEAMDLGNIAHQALERFAHKVEEEGLDWVTMPEEKRERLIDESVEELSLIHI